MGSTPGNLKAALSGRRRRKLRPTTRGCSGHRAAGRIRSSFNLKNGGEGNKEVKCSNKVVSAKLETLKNLIPNGKGGCDVSVVQQADKLFKDTADYILLLRTQVVVLQKLIEVYGSSNTTNEHEDDSTTTNAAVL